MISEHLKQGISLVDHHGHATLYKDFAKGITNFERLALEIDWKLVPISLFGKTHLTPRLVAWQSDPGIDYTYSKITWTSTPWTHQVELIKKHLETLWGDEYNSVLLNYYRNNHDYAAWHRDNEASLGENPKIASISFGATRRFDLRQKDNPEQMVSVDLEDGDLLIMDGALQTHWEHRIMKTAKQTGPRINLSFRKVLQSSSANQEC